MCFGTAMYMRFSRTRSAELIGKLMAAYSQIQEGVAFVIPPPPVRGIGTAGGFKMQIEDRAGRPVDSPKHHSMIAAVMLLAPLLAAALGYLLPGRAGERGQMVGATLRLARKMPPDLEMRPRTLVWHPEPFRDVHRTSPEPERPRLEAADPRLASLPQQRGGLTDGKMPREAA